MSPRHSDAWMVTMPFPFGSHNFTRRGKRNLGNKRTTAPVLFVQLLTDEGIVQELGCEKI